VCYLFVELSAVSKDSFIR